jgi:hypothetical protein
MYVLDGASIADSVRQLAPANSALSTADPDRPLPVTPGNGVRRFSYCVISRRGLTFHLLECAVLAAIFGTILLVPLQLAFDPAAMHFRQFDFVIDCVFATNILLDFITATEIDGVEVFDAETSIRANLQSNFMRDVLAAAPWPLMAGVLQLDKLVPMRLITLLRMTRIFTMTHLQLLAGRATMLKLMKLVFSVFSLAHWLGCFWLAISTWEGHPDNGFAVGTELSRQSNWIQYARAFHWGMLYMI